MWLCFMTIFRLLYIARVAGKGAGAQMRIRPHLFHLAEPPLGHAGTARPHPARRWDSASSEEGTPTPAQHQGLVPRSHSDKAQLTKSPNQTKLAPQGRTHEHRAPKCLNPTQSLRPSAPVPAVPPKLEPRVPRVEPPWGHRAPA